MPLPTIIPGLAFLARRWPAGIRRTVMAENCYPELENYGMFVYMGQDRDTPPEVAPTLTTDTPPIIPAPIPVQTIFGILPSMASGGSGALLGTRFISPAALMSINAGASAVEFKLPHNITIVGLSVTMAAVLAVGHTVDFQFTIGGVDSSAIAFQIAAGGIDGSASGSIAVAAGTTIVVKAVQVGGGGDNIQSLMVVYQ